MQKYKVDWLALTISFEEHDGDKRYFDENILLRSCDSLKRTLRRFQGAGLPIVVRLITNT